MSYFPPGRRLAAILVADAVGYSALMSADEGSTLAALDAAREVFRAEIVARGGRVVDMAGDSVLAILDSAAGAVGAAVAIQDALASAAGSHEDGDSLRFRIGLHLGDVIEKRDGTVYGNGVNIAARLQTLANPGGIAASDAVRGAVRNRVSVAFGDMGQHTVKNIDEAIHVFSVFSEAAVEKRTRLRVNELDLSLPDKPSIAVLPFFNFSGDSDQEYFTDGITEDIISALSRFRSLFVIARSSSFTYRGSAVDVRKVSKELGVRYVVEGSIRRSADRVRVTARLVDGVNANQIWAEKYDRVLRDVFEVQEDVARAIVVAIEPRIVNAELDKIHRRHPQNLTAYELAVRAKAQIWSAYAAGDGELWRRAVQTAERATVVDPLSSVAYLALAVGHLMAVTGGFAQSIGPIVEKGIVAANMAIELDPSNSEAHAVKGCLCISSPEQEDLTQARFWLSRARELNPNDLHALRYQGYAAFADGDGHAALEPLFLALRISPRDPMQYLTNFFIAVAMCAMRNYSEALKYVSRALNDAPHLGYLNSQAAQIHVALGEIDAARARFVLAQKLAPEAVRRRLDGISTTRHAGFRNWGTTMLRIAAGLETPSAATEAW